MADDIETQVEDLIARAKTMPEGAAKRDTFDEAISAADIHQRDKLGFDARMAALWSTYENGDIRLLFAHYAWCLAACDRNPDWDRFNLVWRYRWVIDSMPDTPHISRPQIEDALADMTRRYAADGYSPRPIFVLKRRVYEYMGDRERETAAFEQIRAHKRDEMSDEASTESTFAVDHHTFHKRYAQAARMAEAVIAKLATGDHYAGGLRANMLLPLLTLGETKRAADYHRVGLRINTSRNRSYTTHRSHLEYLTLVGDLPAAAAMAEKHFAEAAADTSQKAMYEFYLTVRLLCDRLAKAGGTPALKAPPLPGVPADDAGRVAVTDLIPYLDSELAGIAGRLDARNGNDYYQRKIADDMTTLTALADRLAAGVTAPSNPDRNRR